MESAVLAIGTLQGRWFAGSSGRPRRACMAVGQADAGVFRS